MNEKPRADFFDVLETRTPQQRTEAIAAALLDHIAHAKSNVPYFSESLADVRARHPAIGRSRLMVTAENNYDAMTCIARSMRRVTA